MKKLLSLAMAICVIMSVTAIAPISAEASETPAITAGAALTSGDFEYQPIDGSTAKITKYSGSDAQVDVPSNIENYTVTNIDDSAFINCLSVKSVTIPDSVTYIGEKAFQGCMYLTDLKLSNNITGFGDYAFVGCRSLESITLPDKLEAVNNWMFSLCTSLKEITATENSVNFCTVDGVLFSKDMSTLVCYPVGKNQISYSVPDSVTTIHRCAFAHCNGLTKIEIGNSVTTVGQFAFYSAANLTSLIISDSATSIDSTAFEYCEKLKEMTVSENNAAYSSAEGILFNKDKTQLVCYPAAKAGSSYSIPASVTSIGDYAFYCCKNFKKMVIPDTVTYLGYCAFEYCENLASIKIPDSITRINAFTFEHCSSLTSITIPNSVEEIGSWVFYGCDKLSSILIGKGVTLIDAYAFYQCDALSNVYYPGTAAGWAKIEIGTNNEPLKRAAMYYNLSKIPPTTISLAKSSAQIYVKGTTTVRATVKYGIGKTTYKSGNTKIARVNSKGVVTGVKKGTAKITVTNNGVNKVFKVTVKNPKLNKTTVNLKKGGKFKLKITGKVGKAKFTSTNKKVALVTSKGVIKAKKRGTAVIKVKTNGMTLKCKVRVK